MTLLHRTPVVPVQLPWSSSPVEMRCRPFYSHRDTEPGHQFSNLFASEVSIDTAAVVPGTSQPFLANPTGWVTFASTENAFQSAKAELPIHDLFVRALSPMGAAMAGQGRLRLSGRQRRLFEDLGGVPVRVGTGKKRRVRLTVDGRYPRRACWEEIKVGVMAEALAAKFSQHPSLWREHADPRGEWPRSFFVEHTTNDAQWGDGGDGLGRNLLGKLLTALLWEGQAGISIDRRSAGFDSWLRAPNREVAPELYRPLAIE